MSPAVPNVAPARGFTIKKADFACGDEIRQDIDMKQTQPLETIGCMIDGSLTCLVTRSYLAEAALG
jgi:hypothetical protein